MTPVKKVAKARKTPRSRQSVRRVAGRGFAEENSEWTSPPQEEPSGTGIAKLFMNGRSQAVRLPKEFRLPGDRVRVHREGDAIVLTPIKKKTDWNKLWAEIDQLVQGQFPEREPQPPMPDDDEELSWD